MNKQLYRAAIVISFLYTYQVYGSSLDNQCNKKRPLQESLCQKNDYSPTSVADLGTKKIEKKDIFISKIPESPEDREVALIYESFQKEYTEMLRKNNLNKQFFKLSPQDKHAYLSSLEDEILKSKDAILKAKSESEYEQIKNQYKSNLEDFFRLVSVYKIEKRREFLEVLYENTRGFKFPIKLSALVFQEIFRLKNRK